MTRLRHTASGDVRAMQISTVQIFAYVEGGLDRPFTERLLALLVPANIRRRVVAMKETEYSTGGKMPLTNHFNDLAGKGLLLDNSFGKPLINLYFMDKDADDALDKLISSPHVAYTPTYDLEGALICYGNLHHAISDAGLMTREQAGGLLGDVDKLLSDISRNWTDWITLCLVAQSKKKNFGCTFDRVSEINVDPLAPPDQVKLREWKTTSRTQLDLSDLEFDRLYTKFRKVVDNSIEGGEPLKYFKGKWLTHVLNKHIEAQPRIPDANIGGIVDRVLSVLVSHVAAHQNCNCSQRYSAFVQGAIEMLEQKAVQRHFGAIQH